MKFTLSWLRDHLETDADLDTICDTLTRIGLEVEEVFDPADALAPFVVGEVLEATQHPDADRLQVCKVSTGDETTQVVCGAPNARTGLKGVFAPPGTYVPGIDLTLKKAKIRGVESCGMLLSERELEISDEHDGIIELDAAAEIGSPAAIALGLDDPVIEIAITPNRPDCLGVAGIARDLAAAGIGTVKDSTPKAIGGAFDNSVPIALEFDAERADACPVFAGRLIKDVTNGPSPDRLQRRLKAIGLRPINALVDITNYISYDRGRPLHVYDADKLTGTIRARLGAKGESFEALDGNRYDVDAEMCVIADDAGVLGLGGIVGGESSGCTAETKTVLIESAYFDPLRTARTGRQLNIQSDARYRFERGVDPAFVEPGIELATAMVLELCGGSPSEVTTTGDVPERDKVITFDFDEVKRLTALDLPEATIKRILTELGFWLSGKGSDYKVAVPSWRPDVSQGADLVEEVLRIVGVDEVPATPLENLERVAAPVLTDGQKRVRRSRRLLASRGLVEAVTYSFIPQSQAEAFGGGADELVLDNPMSSEMSTMRPCLLPGLTSALQRNRDRGSADVALFEIGQAYDGAQPEQQRLIAGGVRAGRIRLEGSGRHWSGAMPEAGWAEAKADAMALLASLGLDPLKVQINRDVPAWLHPGRSGRMQLGPKTVLGTFGELHPATLKALDVDGPIAAFEVFLDAVPTARRKLRTKGALDVSDLQSVRRDFAFIVDRDVLGGDVMRAALGAEKKLVSDVSLFDVFEDDSVGAGKKSLAIEVTLQPRDKTLTDAEIDEVAAKVVAAVSKATGGTLRN